MCSRSALVGPNALSTLGARLSSSGSRSDVLSLDACRSKCMVDAGNTVFVERKPLGCALAQHLSIQIVEIAQTTIFVVLESSMRSKHMFYRARELLAFKPLYSLCLGALGVQTIIFVVPGSSWRSNHYIRSAWELFAFKPLYVVLVKFYLCQMDLFYNY